MIAIVWVCLFNGILFLLLLSVLPTLRGLEQALKTTSELMHEWADQAEAALDPFPQDLMQVRKTLQQVPSTLTAVQKQGQVALFVLSLMRRALRQR